VTAVMKTAAVLLLGLAATAVYADRLVVSADGRFLEYDSGGSFLYLGDTAWELFHKLDREAADLYLRDRAEKGFTVIQAVVLAELDGLRTPNAYGEVPLIDMDPARPNEKYFEHVDYVVSRASDLGLFVGMLPAWGDKVPSDSPGAGPVVFGPDNAAAFGRFLGERYRNEQVIWILGGDRLVSSRESFLTWQAMAEGLEAGHRGGQLMTFHPRGFSSSSYWFHDDEWLDFNMFQSGHGGRLQRNYEFVLNDRALLPAKPVIDGEPAYEGIPVKFWDYMDFSLASTRRVPANVLDEDHLIMDESHFQDGFFERDDLRPHMYWSLFSGAAGYTYGANAVWQMLERGGEVAIPAREDWRDALELPGAGDIRHVRQIFSRRPLSEFEPDQSLVYGPNPGGPGHARALLARDHRTALVYFPIREHLTIRMDTIAGSDVACLWFDPRSGASVRADGYADGPLVTFEPPDHDDWVLIVDSSDSYAGRGEGTTRVAVSSVDPGGTAAVSAKGGNASERSGVERSAACRAVSVSR
jgi:hypothetical protein